MWKLQVVCREKIFVVIISLSFRKRRKICNEEVECLHLIKTYSYFFLKTQQDLISGWLKQGQSAISFKLKIFS